MTGSSAAVRLPTKFMVSIGGFGGPYYEVRLQHGRVQYRADDGQETVTPSIQEWETFWTTMDRIGVWGWDARYDDLATCDGEQWAVEISDGTRRIRSTGSNRYPGGDDREQAKPFQAFLAAVRALTGRPFGGG